MYQQYRENQMFWGTVFTRAEPFHRLHVDTVERIKCFEVRFSPDQSRFINYMYLQQREPDVLRYGFYPGRAVLFTTSTVCSRENQMCWRYNFHEGRIVANKNVIGEHVTNISSWREPVENSHSLCKIVLNNKRTSNNTLTVWFKCFG